MSTVWVVSHCWNALVSVQSVCRLKKSVWNDTDYGTIAQTVVAIAQTFICLGHIYFYFFSFWNGNPSLFYCHFAAVCCCGIALSLF